MLSGGRYDKLIKKLGKKSGDVGFAVYHDRLKYLDRGINKTEKPVLVLYGTDTDTGRIIAEKNKLIAEKVNFDLQKTVTDESLYSRIIDIRAKG